MKPEIELLTFVSGSINGVEFSASGSGTADIKKGITRSYLEYTNFPKDFTPLKCKSWKCKHHPSVAEEIDGGMNLYTICKGNYDIFETIRYPDNQAIYSSAKVRRIGPDRQVVISRFDGSCKGPTDIARTLPYQETLYPAGPGKAVLRGERSVSTKRGLEIKISWDGEVQFVDKTAELPFEEVISYTPLAPARFLREKLRYEKEMKVTVFPKRGPRK